MTSLYDQVRRRAGYRCEYCHMPQEFDPLPFQVDHVVAKKHRGQTVGENLALSCCACNNHKGSNVAGFNPKTGRVVRLFNPRKDVWRRHFKMRGGKVLGVTPTGRATVAVLDMNLPDRVAFREVLNRLGVSWT